MTGISVKRNYRKVIDQHIGFVGIYMSEHKFRENLLHMRQNCLCVNGENAERIHAYTEKTQRDSRRIRRIRQETLKCVYPSQ
jgi:hypothetical protein